MAGIYVRRKLISRRTVRRTTTTLHYFRYDLCVNLINQEVYPLLVVNHLLYTPAYLLVGFIVSSRSEKKLERLAYAENRYPRRTIRPKIDPRHTYAQLKKLNGSPAVEAWLSYVVNPSVCHVHAPYSAVWNYYKCFTPFVTSAILWHRGKIWRRSSHRDPFFGG